jgi:transposase
VLARQYGAIGNEIASMDKSIMALHRGCEASRRLAEIPGIGPIGATALIAEISDWKTFSWGRSVYGLNRFGAEAARHQRLKDFDLQQGVFERAYRPNDRSSGGQRLSVGGRGDRIAFEPMSSPML